MGRAAIYVSLHNLANVLQLPDYLDVVSVYINPELQRLEISVDSPAIPDEVVEIRPAYCNHDVFMEGENPMRSRRLVEIDLIEGNRVDT